MEKINKKAVLLATVTGSFLTPYGASSINIALPAIGSDLKMNAVMLSWVGTLYLLSAAVFLVPFGRLGDIYGRKRIFFWGIVISTIASFIKALSTSVSFLMVMQVVHGAAAAMVFATAIAIVTSLFPPSERGKMLGINVASTYFGLSLGPVIGGILTQYWGWRSVFISNVPLGLFVMLTLLLTVKGDQAEAQGERFDLQGSIIYAMGLIALIYGVSRLPAFSGYLLSGAGILGLVMFFWFETTIQSPVLHTGLFKGNTVFTLSNFAALINYSATHAVVFLLSLYLQYIKGFAPQKAGLVLFVQPLIMALCSPFAGRLSDRLEPGIIASLGMAINVIGLIMLSSIGESTSINFVFYALVVLGIGVALFSTPNTNAAMGSVERRYYGIASASIATMRTLGQMFSMAVSTLIFSLLLGSMQITAQTSQPFLFGLRMAFYIFSGMCAFGILASLARGKVLDS